MRKQLILFASMIMICYIACGSKPVDEKTNTSFDYIADNFADVQVLRYKIDGFESLSLKQKELAYYLTQAGLSGRDIFYDQKYSHGLTIRRTLEAILNSYSGERTSDEWKKFEVYCKRFFFANGNHHHYSADKFIPGCSREYFATLILNSDRKQLPIENQNTPSTDFLIKNTFTDIDILSFITKITPIIYDVNIDKKTVDLSAEDVVVASSNNFYEQVTQKQAEAFYSDYVTKHPEDKSQIGFNSKLVNEDGKLREKVWMSGGMYGPAIDKIIFWLSKASDVAENMQQKDAIDKLIAFYRSGDPKDFDTYCIAWVNDTNSVLDAVNGFIEVYQDALQRKAAFESVVSMKDKQATQRIEAISKQAQWFEDNSPIMNEHKKKNVKGITAKVITVINEVGDAAPLTPIGINLPNNEWIREEHGSKSVSLGNIIDAYNYYRAKSPMIDEFGYDKESIDRLRRFGVLADHLHTDMHEVIGHASGKLNDNVRPPEETLKNYAGVLEEARADLVALYYAMDQKLVEIGVTSSTDVGKAEYDYYILNGMMYQLNRLEEGKNLEEAHMRNRQLIAKWAYEKGKTDSVIVKNVRDGKTFFVVKDYNKLRNLFGSLLNEIQRIKSEGDFDAAKKLVEGFGVEVDQALLKEVHERYSRLGMAPYMGFIQPKLVPVMKDGKITDVKVEYPKTFLEQMLEYGKEYSFLPNRN